MMIALLASVAALLVAAAGVARHIWLQRGRVSGKPAGSEAKTYGKLSGTAGSATSKPGRPDLARQDLARQDPADEMEQEIEL